MYTEQAASTSVQGTAMTTTTTTRRQANIWRQANILYERCAHASHLTGPTSYASVGVCVVAHLWYLLPVKIFDRLCDNQLLVI